MKIEYDTPIEVTPSQYEVVMREYAGCVAGRRDGDKYFIKVWLMRYRSAIESTLVLTK